MTQPERIIAATDLSAPARHAAERAAMVSKEINASLELLHAADLAPLERLRQIMGATSAEMETRVLDVARQRLGELATSIEQRFGVAASTHVVAGTLISELTKKKDALANGLLVCGATGESVVRRFVLGTTALRLLGKTSCPVLVVKQPPREPYRRLLIPVDFSAFSLLAIKHGRCVAPQADVVLMHVFDVPFEGKLRYAGVEDDVIHQYRIAARQEANQKLQALRDQAGLTPYDCSLVVLHGDPTWRVIEQEQERDSDLIVMGKHGENIMEQLLIGSVTKRVLAECSNDVLVSTASDT